jgi:hypothetical protein
VLGHRLAFTFYLEDSYFFRRPFRALSTSARSIMRVAPDRADPRLSLLCGVPDDRRRGMLGFLLQGRQTLPPAPALNRTRPERYEKAMHRLLWIAWTTQRHRGSLHIRWPVYLTGPFDFFSPIP